MHILRNGIGIVKGANLDRQRRSSAYASVATADVTFSFSQIDGVSLALWQLQEALHGPEVHQKRLRCTPWVLLFAQNL